MKKDNIYQSLLLTFLIMLLFISPVEAKFNDMPNNWARESLEHSVKHGILRGDNKGNINPDTEITRAELATMISRLLNLNEKADLSSFKDVSKDKWYYEDLSKLVKAGILKGNHEGNLEPSKAISREETFVILSRVLGLDIDYYGNDNSYYYNLEEFTDHNKISPWAKFSIDNLVYEEYVSGNNKKEINPKANITRAEVAKLFHNISPHINDFTSKNIEGNLLINQPNKEIKDLRINGDLILSEGINLDEITLKNTQVYGRVVVRDRVNLNIQDYTYLQELNTLQGGVVELSDLSMSHFVRSLKPIKISGPENSVIIVTLKEGADNSEIKSDQVNLNLVGNVKGVKDKYGNLVTESNIINEVEEFDLGKGVKLKDLNPELTDSIYEGNSVWFSIDEKELEKHFGPLYKITGFIVRIGDTSYLVGQGSEEGEYTVNREQYMYAQEGFTRQDVLEATVYRSDIIFE